jgi:hypothetical protein
MPLDTNGLGGFFGPSAKALINRVLEMLSQAYKLTRLPAPPIASPMDASLRIGTSKTT